MLLPNSQELPISRLRKNDDDKEKEMEMELDSVIKVAFSCDIELTPFGKTRVRQTKSSNRNKKSQSNFLRRFNILIVEMPGKKCAITHAQLA